MPEHDAIIVGGGIQGMMMGLELARRGSRPLVLERGALGDGATSASLGVVHGGLRYLQSLDLKRWHRSRREQDWFGREFAQFTAPLACVMPLYRGALRSRALFRAAFLFERACAALTGLDRRSTGARLVPPAEAAAVYPVPRRGLVGGASWPELALTDARGLLREIGRRIEALGGAVREQAEVVKLDVADGRVRGVITRDGERHHASDTVLLCPGAASRMLARRFDRDIPALSSRVLAFNLLFDYPAVPGYALAVSPDPGRGRSYFVREHKGKLLAGTYYAPLDADPEPGERPIVPAALVAQFQGDLVRALPLLEGVPLLETWAGILPDVDGRGRKLRNHDLLWEHGANGGPKGLWTLLGTKLTTAHALAVDVAQRLPITKAEMRA